VTQPISQDSALLASPERMLKHREGHYRCQNRRIEWTRMIWSDDERGDDRDMFQPIDRDTKQESNQKPIDGIENSVRCPRHNTARPNPSLLKFRKPWLWLVGDHLS
jgi:hypothetical protein